MQKGDAAKLKLLLSGISARLTKNRDFFVQAVCTFTSGKKKFDARLTRTDKGMNCASRAARAKWMLPDSARSSWNRRKSSMNPC